MKVTIRPEFRWLPPGREAQFHVLTTLVKNEEGGNVRVRPPISLAIVIDASGSMEGLPMEQTQKAIREVLVYLTRRDRVTCVAFNERASRIFPLVELTDKPSLWKKFGTISPFGYTNLSAGWLMGIDEMCRAFRKENINRLFLLSDGKINRGVTGMGGLRNIAEKARKGGIITSTFGFGENFQEGLLKELAAAGGGNFHFIRQPEDTATVFRTEFGEIAQLAGQNGEVQIEFPEGVEIAEELSLLPFRDEGRTRVYELGDILFGVEHQLIFRLRVRPGTSSGIFQGKARFLSVEKGFEWDETGFSFSADLRTDPGPPAIDEEILDQVILAKTAICKQEGFHDWESGQHAIALQAFADRSQIIRDRLKDPMSVMKEPLERELLLLERLIIDLQEGSAHFGKNIQVQCEDFAKKRGTYVQARQDRVFVVNRKLSSDDVRERVAVTESVHQALSDLGLDGEFKAKCRTVFDELLANALEHGCGNYPGGVVKIDAQFSRSRAIVSIRDSGQGFDFPTVIEKARTHLLQSGSSIEVGGSQDNPDQAQFPGSRGRGLAMVLSTGCEIGFSGRGNEVTARLFNRLPEGAISSDSISIRRDKKPRTLIGIRNLVIKGELVGVLEVAGKIDVFSIPMLKEQARRFLDRGVTYLMIEIGALDYLDSSGLGFFVGTQQLCRNLGGGLFIVKPSNEIQSLFRNLAFDRIVPVVSSEQEIRNFIL